MKSSHTRCLNYRSKCTSGFEVLCVFHWCLLAAVSRQYFSWKKINHHQNKTSKGTASPWVHMNKHCWFAGSWWAPLPGKMSWDQMYLVKKWSDGPTVGNQGLPLVSSWWKLCCQLCLWRPSLSLMFPLVPEGTGEFAIPVYDFWVDASACYEIQDHAVRPPATWCQWVCDVGTLKRAKRLFGHGMSKSCVGGWSYQVEGPNRQWQAAQSGQKNQGDLLGWKWVPAWLKTFKGKKANHHGDVRNQTSQLREL